MKKNKIILGSLLLSVASFASIDVSPELTAEYGANPAQQGAINYGSSVYYNPAGLTELKEGNYFVGGVQHKFGHLSSNPVGFDNSEGDITATVPNFALYKVMDKKAFYLTYSDMGSGEYETDRIDYILPIKSLAASALPQNINDSFSSAGIKATNEYEQITLGAAFEVNNKLSLSGGIKGIFAERTLDMHATVNDNIVFDTVDIGGGYFLVGKDYATLNSKRDDIAFGFQLGLNYKATDKLNIGAKYDSKIKLDFENKTAIDGEYRKGTEGGFPDLVAVLFPQYRDGAKSQRDIPAVLGLGASYMVNDKITTYVGGNYYFNEDANIDEVSANGFKYKNGYDLSIGGEYKINDKFSWLAGASYTKTGVPEELLNPSEIFLDYKTLGTGLKYNSGDSMEITVSYSHYFFDSVTYGGFKYKKDLSAVGFNFVKKF